MTATTWTAWLTRNGFEDLFGIKHGVPHTFNGLTWAPTDADVSAAWEFYTELRTRITTQRLAYRCPATLAVPADGCPRRRRRVQ